MRGNLRAPQAPEAAQCEPGNLASKPTRYGSQSQRRSKAEWKTVPPSKLLGQVARGRELGQHIFVWDKTGEVPALFECHSGVHIEMTELMVEVALTKEDVRVDQILDNGLREIRETIQRATSERKPLLLNLGMLAPDFRRVYTHPSHFDANEVFKPQPAQRSGQKLNQQRLRKMSQEGPTAGDMSQLTESTQPSSRPRSLGRTSRVDRHPSAAWHDVLAIRSCCEEEGELNKVLERIPYSNHFRKVIVDYKS